MEFLPRLALICSTAILFLHPSKARVSSPCTGTGGGWRLVRWVPPGNSWHPARDELKGTEEYGDPANMNNAFSIKFDQFVFNQFLFSTGDCNKWLIAGKDEVVGSDGEAFYTNEYRVILKSSTSDDAYKAKWYRRKGQLEDPWISLTDHQNAIPNNDILYGENSFGNPHAIILNQHNGAMVYIRNGQRECEYDIDIGGENEDLLYAGTKSSGKECQAACQGNSNCDFFVWGGPGHIWRSNGCWLKQFKGQSFNQISRRTLDGAVSGTVDCLYSVKGGCDLNAHQKSCMIIPVAFNALHAIACDLLTTDPDEIKKCKTAFKVLAATVKLSCGISLAFLCDSTFCPQNVEKDMCIGSNTGDGKVNDKVVQGRDYEY